MLKMLRGVPDGKYPKSSGFKSYLYDGNSPVSVKRGAKLEGIAPNAFVPAR